METREIDRINALRLAWAPKDEEEEDEQYQIDLPDATKVRIKRLPVQAIDLDVGATGVTFQRCGGGKRVFRKRV